MSMSIENRPNLNAAGLVTDIIIAISKRIRGNAGEAGMKQVLPLLSDEITNFANSMDEQLNQYFGKVKNDPDALLKRGGKL